jgi:hypothetical protein
MRSAFSESSATFDTVQLYYILASGQRGKKKRKTLCMLHSTAGRMQFTSSRYDCVPSLYLMKRPDCAVYCIICRSRYIYISQLPIEKKSEAKNFKRSGPASSVPDVIERTGLCVLSHSISLRANRIEWLSEDDPLFHWITLFLLPVMLTSFKTSLEPTITARLMRRSMYLVAIQPNKNTNKKIIEKRTIF